MPQTKEAKRAAAIARNEQYRSRYEAQAKKAGLTSASDIKEYADRKVGIPKPKETKVISLE